MERSLNPELLRTALGEHETLPSPDDLHQLLAEAEIQLLLGKPTSDSQLYTTAWYLHAVASSPFATQLYGVDRQRAAFRVAGHIFDLRLKTMSGTSVETWVAQFAAQVAYVRSELQPNSLAIYRARSRDLPTRQLDVTDDLDRIALWCGMALLAMDAQYLHAYTRGVAGQIRDAERAWEVEFDSSPFAAAGFVAVAARDMATFLVYGDVRRLEAAQSWLTRALAASGSAYDTNSRWVAAQLRSIGDGLAQASIWGALPPDTPATVKQSFTVARPRVLTLWPPQIDMLKRPAGAPNPLTAASKRLFISSPTSAGKTLFAHLVIASHLGTKPSSVCYVAPTRSLCSEVRRALAPRVAYIGAGVISGLPEWHTFDALVDSAPRLEIMTPERLAFLLRRDFDGLGALRPVCV